MREDLEVAVVVQRSELRRHEVLGVFGELENRVKPQSTVLSSAVD